MVFVVMLAMIFSTVFSYAASDPAVVLVNPTSGGTVYANNFLISIKITAPKTIKVSVYEELQEVNGVKTSVDINSLISADGTLNTSNLTSVSVITPSAFTCTNNLSFFTKQINGLKPGLYRIKIDTVDSAGKIIYTQNSYVALKEKPAESEANIFETPQSGTMQFLQNLLKSIFGS